jgi:hypothetical protein
MTQTNRTPIFVALIIALFVATISEPRRTTANSKSANLVAGGLTDLLSQTGPQLPASFNANDLAMFYIIRGNWPIAISYELPRGSAKFQLKPVNGGSVIVVELPATAKGKVGKVIVTTPKEYGDVPQAAELRIVANGSEFVLHSLGCGGGAFANGSNRSRPHGQLYQHANSDEVAISGIVVSPQDILDTTNNAKLSFSFRSTNDFPMWSAAFERQVQNSGSRWRIEKLLNFPSDPINQGQTKQSSWDGKNAQGRVVAGRYKVMVNAWTSAAADGSSVTTFSSPAFTVR